jgi:hypothetical protein
LIANNLLNMPLRRAMCFGRLAMIKALVKSAKLIAETVDLGLKNQWMK